MYENLETWLNEIFNDPEHKFEPVEGEWGMMYAGSVDGKTSYLAFPNLEIQYSINTGLITVAYDQVPGLGEVFHLQWATPQSEKALPFIYDFVQSANLFDNPLKVLKNKEKVWKVFEDPDRFNLFFSKVVGLWGEMNFVIRNDSVSTYWTGPLGSDADIVSDKTVIELKTTTKKTFDSVSISSLWQLEDKERKIFISLMSIQLSTETGKSLTDLRKEINSLNISEKLLRKIDSELDLYGSNLCDLKFTMREVRVYPVDELFPCLTRNLLSSCMPQNTLDRILKLNYTVSIAGLSNITEKELIKSFLQ